MKMDMKILELIRSSLQCDFLDMVMPFITRLGYGSKSYAGGTLLQCIIKTVCGKDTPL